MVRQEDEKKGLHGMVFGLRDMREIMVSIMLCKYYTHWIDTSDKDDRIAGW